MQEQCGGVGVGEKCGGMDRRCARERGFGALSGPVCGSGQEGVVAGQPQSPCWQRWQSGKWASGSRRRRGRRGRGTAGIASAGALGARGVVAGTVTGTVTDALAGGVLRLAGTGMLSERGGPRVAGERERGCNLIASSTTPTTPRHPTTSSQSKCSRSRSARPPTGCPRHRRLRALSRCLQLLPGPFDCEHARERMEERKKTQSA